MAKQLKRSSRRPASRPREIAQRELRNDISRVLAEVERGHQFHITVRGRPIAAIVPLPQRRTWVPAEEIKQMLRRLPVDRRFMKDVDGAVDNTIRDPWKRS